MKTINFQTVRHETPSCKTTTHMYVNGVFNLTQTIENMKHGIFKSINICEHKGDVVEYINNYSIDGDRMIKEFVHYKAINNIVD